MGLHGGSQQRVLAVGELGAPSWRVHTGWREGLFLTACPPPPPLDPPTSILQEKIGPNFLPGLWSIKPIMVDHKFFSAPLATLKTEHHPGGGEAGPTRPPGPLPCWRAVADSSSRQGSPCCPSLPEALRPCLSPTLNACTPTPRSDLHGTLPKESWGAVPLPLVLHQPGREGGGGGGAPSRAGGVPSETHWWRAPLGLRYERPPPAPWPSATLSYPTLQEGSVDGGLPPITYWIIIIMALVHLFPYFLVIV